MWIEIVVFSKGNFKQEVTETEKDENKITTKEVDKMYTIETIVLCT